MGSEGSGSGGVCLTTPRLGMSVVNGYAATSGEARVTAFRMLDLPALGKPTNPMSATTRMSSSTVSSCPGSPLVAVNVASSSSMSLTSTSSESLPESLPRRLARRCACCARRAARPPAPPSAMSSVWPCLVMSPSSSPLLLRRTTVPGGTSMYRSSCVGAMRVRSARPAPAPGAAEPWYPFLARQVFLSWNGSSESHARSTRM